MRRLLLFAALVVVSSCSDPSNSGSLNDGGLTPNASACTLGSECASGQCTSGLCVPAGGCVPGSCPAENVCLGSTCTPVAVMNTLPDGGSCGEQEYGSSTVAPNILILMDMSTSMVGQKWTDAKSAMDGVADSLAGAIRFGVAVYPGSSSCGAARLLLPIGNHTAAAIKQSYADESPNGYTPLSIAFDTIRTHNWLHDTTDPSDEIRKRAVVLVNDGKPNCAGGVASLETDTTAPDHASQLHATGVDIYVVGFGSGGGMTGWDPEMLTSIATQGGTTNPAAPDDRYFTAASANALQSALTTIAAGMAGCDFAINGTVPDTGKLWVFNRGIEMPRDPTKTNGWEYESTGNHIVIHGAACDALKADSARELKIVLGCRSSISRVN